MHSLELWRNFICGNETGSPGRAVSLHLARSGSQSEHRIRRILPARRACHIIKSNKVENICLIWMLLIPGKGNGERGTGNGERGTGNGEPGTGVWELVYSGNTLENSKWRSKQKKRLEEKQFG